MIVQSAEIYKQKSRSNKTYSGINLTLLIAMVILLLVKCFGSRGIDYTDRICS